MGEHFPQTLGTRVCLRALHDEDASVLQAYRSAPQVARFQSWDTDYSLEDAKSLTQSMVSTPFGVRGEWYQVGIALIDKDKLIGDFGVYFDKTDRACVEIGYSLAEDAQGQGYASEALGLLLDLLVKSQGISKVKAVTDVRNGPSRKLLKALGFDEVQVFEKNGFYKGEWCDEVLCLWQGPADITLKA